MRSIEETNNLVHLAQSGDESAKNTLLKENYPLIKSVIRRYKSNSIEYDDLYQLGCMGFAKAINNFDESFGVKFSTYAVPMIAGEVKRFLRDDGVIKVSRSVKQKAREINQYINDFVKTYSESPTIQHLSEHFEIEMAELVFILESSKMPISINNKFDNSSDSAEVSEMLPAEHDSSERLLNKLALKDILSILEPKDKKIILMRYFLDKTQSEIAKTMGVSQVQISRIESRILQTLKDKIEL